MDRLCALALLLVLVSCRHPVRSVQAPKTNPVGSGWLDLRPLMELRIENAYYREGEPKRGIAGFLGTETAHYQVRANRGLRLLAVESAVARRPRDQGPVQELIQASQRNFRRYRYYYAVVFNKRGGIRGSVLLGAGSIEEIERLGAQLVADPDLICGGESRHCTVFPEACTVALEMEIVVNGVARVVPWGAAAVTGTVAALANHSQVAVTLEATPQTVLAVGDLGHPTMLKQLETLAATPADHQFAWSPFTPVSAAGLVNSGLSSELALQVSRGSQVLATDVTHTAPAQTGGGVQLGAWFANEGLDAATLTQLQADGYSNLVVPPANVPSSPTNGSTAEPFQVTSSRGSAMTAVTDNADLSSRFTGAPGNPVLAAHQLMAEVAQMYYEKPNANAPRGLVAMAPANWSDDPAFVDALMAALTENPIIQPVTTSGLFTALPTGSCRSGCRLSPATGPSTLPVAAIRNQRSHVSGFTASARSAVAVGSQLGDLVLVGESAALRPNQQSAVLRNAGAAVDAQLAQLVVAGDPITLTSQRGTVQVTIVSYAPYPVTTSLTLTSDKLLFPGGTSEWTTRTTLIGRGHTNIVPVTVQARGSGTSKVTIVLRPPGGGPTLSSGQVSVRSTATSLVGVLLSVGAVLVLLAWWIRTSRKRRVPTGAELEPAAAER